MGGGPVPMIGDEASPGRLARLIDKVPEGFVLRAVFGAMLGLSAVTVFVDYRERADASADIERRTRTEPMPQRRPEPGDQVRPYLPRTIPVGPDRGEPSLPGYDGPVDGAAMAEPMRFVRAGDGVASAVGTIAPGTAERLRVFLDAARGVGLGNASATDRPVDGEGQTFEPGQGAVPLRRLYLHSPGGSVDDAIVMARLLRERRITTIVPPDGYCASACPLLMAGGVTRRAGANAWIGVHQVYAVPTEVGLGLARDVDRSIADIQETIARCQALLVEMGVDPAVWIKAMQTPADSLYVLTAPELAAYRLVRPFPDDAGFIGPPAPARPDRPASSVERSPATGSRAPADEGQAAGSGSGSSAVQGTAGAALHVG